MQEVTAGRLPAWFRQGIPGQESLGLMRRVRDAGLATVCREAHCPNAGSCFSRSQLTILILGASCTRQCRFCSVEKKTPAAPDPQEPARVAAMIEELGVKYAVITSVTRDDLPDGGAGHFVRTLIAIRRRTPWVRLEALIPDFQGMPSSLALIAGAPLEVVAHNLETVSRLYPRVRPGADYLRSLGLLRRIKDLRPSLITKSSLMLGMGEAEDELVCALRDLRESRVDLVTLGQYLQPTPGHYPVAGYIRPEAFERYKSVALSLGFKAALAGPLVRSSFKAEELYHRCSYA